MRVSVAKYITPLLEGMFTHTTAFKLEIHSRVII